MKFNIYEGTGKIKRPSTRETLPSSSCPSATVSPSPSWTPRSSFWRPPPVYRDIVIFHCNPPDRDSRLILKKKYIYIQKTGKRTVLHALTYSLKLNNDEIQKKNPIMNCRRRGANIHNPVSRSTQNIHLPSFWAHSHGRDRTAWSTLEWFLNDFHIFPQ